MLLPILAMIIGILVLMWAADRFVEGAAAVATKLGMSQLLIGMTIVGFGTSFPEMMVSALSSWQGASGIALGNAYGSNICNIALILGVTALVNPTPVNSIAVRREIPILLAVSVFAGIQLWWGFRLTRVDALVLLAIFAVYMYYTVRADLKANREQEALAKEGGEETAEKEDMPFNKAIMWVVVGLLLLMASSRLLVWGAVETALYAGISELTIGLTIVAVGTSLPEFASSLAAARKNNHDIAVGNIIGSNLFNTLVVVGIAGLVRPMTVDPVVLYRDIVVMLVVTVALYQVCRPRGKAAPIITRFEGGVLLLMFIAYTLYLAWDSMTQASAAA
jgi:cation:H+ antiporter